MMSKRMNSARLLILFPISFWMTTAHSEALNCSISTTKGRSQVDHCLTITSKGNVTISSKVLKKVNFNKDGLAEVLTKDQGCFWMNRKGTVRRTHCFDNGADYFVENFSRYIATNGKFGFMNKKLEIVIPANFDFIFPFEHGKAKFCQGCKSVQQGEYKSIVGGVWGQIDKKGAIIVPKAVR